MRQSKSHWLIAALVVTLFGAAGQSQESPRRDLVLTGTVIGVKPVSVVGSAKNNEDSFEIELYLQFKNNTERPLIIFTPYYLDGFISIHFQDELSPSATSGTLAKVIPRYFSRLYDYPKHSRKTSKQTEYEYDPSKELVGYLSGPSPSTYVFAVIEPHGYFECRDKVVVSDGYTLETRSAGKSKVKIAKSEYAALRVQYLVSANSRKDMGDILLAAKERWSTTGTFPLDGAGSYDVTSEIILNKPSE